MTFMTRLSLFSRKKQIGKPFVKELKKDFAMLNIYIESIKEQKAFVYRLRKAFTVF